MTTPRVFISFDFDHDADLRDFIVGQSRHPDTPFSIVDWSMREAVKGDWRHDARTRIRRSDQVIIVCGEFTNHARGVAEELEIARQEGRPYFFLWGRKDRQCYLPPNAYPHEKIYKWTWDNLKALLSGAR